MISPSAGLEEQLDATEEVAGAAAEMASLSLIYHDEEPLLLFLL
jgi:hypothetical protein